MKDFINKLKTYFFTGLALVFPIFFTVVILKWFLRQINIWFLEPFFKFIRPYMPSPFLIFLVKGLLLILLIAIIIGIGMVTRLIFVRKFLGWGERLLQRMPFVSKIYLATKDVSAAIFGQRKGLFKRVVLIEYPREGLYAIGFVTAEHIGRELIKRPLEDDLISIFVPTSPTPTTGYFLFMPKKDVIEVSLSVEEAIKLILSGGAVSPQHIQKKIG